MLRSPKVAQFLSQLDMCQIVNCKSMMIGSYGNTRLYYLELTAQKFMQIYVFRASFV